MLGWYWSRAVASRRSAPHSTGVLAVGCRRRRLIQTHRRPRREAVREAAAHVGVIQAEGRGSDARRRAAAAVSEGLVWRSKVSLHRGAGYRGRRRRAALGPCLPGAGLCVEQHVAVVGPPPRAGSRKESRR